MTQYYYYYEYYQFYLIALLDTILDKLLTLALSSPIPIFLLFFDRKSFILSQGIEHGVDQMISAFETALLLFLQHYPMICHKYGRQLLLMALSVRATIVLQHCSQDGTTLNVAVDPDDILSRKVCLKFNVKTFFNFGIQRSRKKGQIKSPPYVYQLKCSVTSSVTRLGTF